MPYAGHAYDMVGKPKEIMSKFEKDQRVYVSGKVPDLDDERYDRMPGVVLGEFPGGVGSGKKYIVKTEDGHSYYFFESQIEPRTEIDNGPAKFKAGDRVNILNNPGFESGTVIGLRPGYSGMIEVKVDGRTDGPHHFYLQNQIVLISSANDTEVNKLYAELAPEYRAFKVGDRVKVLDSAKRYYPQYIGKTGKVQTAQSGYSWLAIDDYHCAFYNTDLELVLSAEDIALVNKLNEPVFKVGDRVRITKNVGPDRLGWTVGKEGAISRDDGPGTKYRYAIVIDGLSLVFNAEELQLLSPQCSQPQTTEPKEDTMKPYAVIVHSLNATQTATIQGNYTTEAEAKEAAEIEVAQRRSNQAIKNYFAVTIVNTKTGKLVGSVVDAPPVVEWATE